MKRKDIAKYLREVSECVLDMCKEDGHSLPDAAGIVNGIALSIALIEDKNAEPPSTPRETAEGALGLAEAMRGIASMLDAIDKAVNAIDKEA